MPTPQQQVQQKYAPPLNRNWTRRAYHSSVLIGDWIYIHQGEVAVGSEPYSDGITDPHSTLLAVNATLSLHIGSSWTDPRTLSFQAFPKTKSAVYNYGTMWYDEHKNEVFTFGGEQSKADTGNRPQLTTEKLIPTSDGYGTWTTNSTEKDQPFTRLGLTRSIGGATAQSNTTGFWLGGYQTNATSDETQSLDHYVPTPNLVTYDFKNGAWANSTLDPTLPLGIPNGTIEWAGMEYLPTLGPNGMLVIWGGETSNTTVYTPASQGRPMTNIVLYDPVTKRWYLQHVDGVAPSVRNQFCSVSASDPTPFLNATQGTHEIYMHGGFGGIPGPGNRAYDEIWVLSIPSFTWSQVDSFHTTARVGHTCHVIGKRQMISLGGVDMEKPDPFGSPDFNNWNGIGIFDLSTSTWADGFNKDAQDYRRPKLIEQTISTSGSYPTTWTQQSLASLIVNRNTNDVNNGPLTGMPSSNAGSEAHSSSSKSNYPGVIAGATIGGIIAAIVPFIVLYFYYYHYRPKHTVKEITELPTELGGHNQNRRNSHPQSIRAFFSRRRRSDRRHQRERSEPRFRVELAAGETVGELAQPTPALIAPTNTTTITGGDENRKSSAGDYFSFLRPSGWKTPQVITPGIKEVPVAITPKGSQDGGRPAFIPKVPHISGQYLRPPSFLRRTSNQDMPRYSTERAPERRTTNIPASLNNAMSRAGYDLEKSAPVELGGPHTPGLHPHRHDPPNTNTFLPRAQKSDPRMHWSEGEDDHEISSPSSFLDDKSLYDNPHRHSDQNRPSPPSDELPFSPVSAYSSSRGEGRDFEGKKRSPDSTFFMDDD